MSDWVGIFIILISLFCGGFALGVKWGEPMLDSLKALPPAQPDIIHCKDCKYWMPYDWMFSEIWRSVSMDDYSDDEIGCAYCDMNMHADDFCSRAERKTNG